jgi:hypothetical protein
MFVSDFDVDALLSPPLKIKIGGKLYDIPRPLNIEQFLALEPKREAFQKSIFDSVDGKSKGSNTKVAEATKALIRAYSQGAGLDNGVLDGLTTKQLMRLCDRLAMYHGSGEDSGGEPGKVPGASGA